MIERDNFKAPIPPLRSKSYFNIIGQPLTDKRIAHYEARGYYSAEFREARRQHMAKKSKVRRAGNFMTLEDGRMVYSP